MSRDRDNSPTSQTPTRDLELSPSPRPLGATQGTPFRQQPLSNEQFQQTICTILEHPDSRAARWLIEDLRIDARTTLAQAQKSLRFSFYDDRILMKHQLVAEALAASAFNSDVYRVASSGRTDHWEQLNPGERFSVCQKGEQIIAAIQGRPPAMMSWFWGEGEALFNRENFLSRINYDTVLRDTSDRLAIESTVHESTHADDWFELETRRPGNSVLSLAERKELRFNFDHPVPPGDTLEQRRKYFRQLSERRAYWSESDVWNRFDEFRNTSKRTRPVDID